MVVSLVFLQSSLPFQMVVALVFLHSGVGTVAAVAAMAATLFHGSFFNFYLDCSQPYAAIHFVDKRHTDRNIEKVA